MARHCDGVGLAVCQRILWRFGGKIWVEAEPGRGSVFRFTLRRTAGAPPVVAEDAEVVSS